MSTLEPQRPPRANAWAAPDLPALTAVRFFAAFAVVLFHAAGPLIAWAASVEDTASAPAALALRVAMAPVGWAQQWGYLGVSFFFVLSGFILTHVYAGAREPGAIDRRRFWVARVARVYPVYLLGMVGCLPLVVLGSLDRYDLAGAAGHIALSAVPALLLVHGWIAAWVPLWNYPSWSVAAEAFFYLLFPWVIPILVRHTRRRPFATGATVWLAGMSLPVLFVLLAPGHIPTGHDTPGMQPSSPWLRLVEDAPLFHLQQFLLGIVAGRFFVERRERLHGDTLTIAGLALMAIGLAASGPVPVPWMHDGLLAPAFALIILGLAAGGRVARLLTVPGLVKLGAASYTLYILQNPLADGMQMLFALARPDLLETVNGQATTALATILTMIAISLLVTRRIEDPARRWILARFGARRPAPAIATAPAAPVG